VYFELANVLVFAAVAIGFVFANLLLSQVLLRPPSTGTLQGKLSIYECGEPTIGQAWIRFDIRFYTVALMFVVFDVEVALLFPWGAIFRDLVEQGQGWLGFVEAGAFILILMAGLAYVWARGDLDWTPEPGEQVRTTTAVDRAPAPAERPAAEPVGAAAPGAPRA
jgi:NADH-quinone oxidoreductase subunit A